MNLAEQRIVDVVVAQYGATIDLRDRPDAIPDIIRRFGPVLLARPDPPRARGRAWRVARWARQWLLGVGRCTGRRMVRSKGDLSGQPTTADVMKQLLMLAREVHQLREQQAGRECGVSIPPLGGHLE